MKKKILIALVVVSLNLMAQFAGPVGAFNTTAMHADSNAFISWGTTCKVTRGLQDISYPVLGYATVGDSSMVVGKADGNSIVSLGDGGQAIVTFSMPISNALGYDFAVFENSFNDSFLELAFVEVSSDGINYFRFPSVSNSQTSIQFTNGAVMDATKINNLAGKYRAQYGTPFDLQELAGISALLNVNAITHIKIIDVVGSLDPVYARYDKNGNVINDPWTTAYPNSGFDLDAIGVIHQWVGIEELGGLSNFQLFPNPVSSKLKVQSSKFKENAFTLRITNVLGEELKLIKMESEVLEINVSDWPKGVYFVGIENENEKTTYKLIKE